jgi:predicted nucleic-acid-binding protein
VIGLDTNVVVRYITQDDSKQSALATTFFERTLSAEQPGFIPAVVLCEIAWVLADCYGADRARVREVIEGLLSSKQIKVENAELAWKALRALEVTQADFSDALIGQIVAAHGGTKTVTFDKAVSKLAGFELLGMESRVAEPGRLRYKGKAKTIEEMDAAVMSEARKHK